MTCEPQLFAGCDVDQEFTIDESEDFDTTDMTSTVITLTSKRDKSISVVYNAITKTGANSFILRIDENDITKTGAYSISVAFTDLNGYKRCVTPCPEFITFS